MTRTAWTLLAFATLGGTALAEPARGDAAEVMATVAGTATGGSARGVSQDYLVLPAGGELTGEMRFVTSDPALGGQALKFSDLGLFDLAGRWALISKLEISAGVTLVPKQPSYTDEKPWQSVALGLRSPLGHKAAVSLSGAGGHLLDHTGMWTREALMIEWRHPVAEIVDFGITGGIDGVSLSDRGSSRNGLVTELAIATSALFREPTGHWGGWVGVSYALPVVARGGDPTTGLDLDPQARLDLRVGSVLSVSKQWDLFAELAIIDRGDLSNPATRLPILDGGFDQRQVVLGVTRHLEKPGKRPNRGDAYELSMAAE